MFFYHVCNLYYYSIISPRAFVEYSSNTNARIYRRFKSLFSYISLHRLTSFLRIYLKLFWIYRLIDLGTYSVRLYIYMCTNLQPGHGWGWWQLRSAAFSPECHLIYACCRSASGGAIAAHSNRWNQTIRMLPPCMRIGRIGIWKIC
jgi:hypothetical protein